MVVRYIIPEIEIIEDANFFMENQVALYLLQKCIIFAPYLLQILRKYDMYLMHNVQKIR